MGAFFCMEESAEAPPAAEEARRIRGSVPTAGRGSGWEPADTAVSNQEHAKKITTQMGGDLCDCPQVLLSALPPTARKGECEGETFAGFPTRVQSPARRRPLLRSKSAAPKKKDTHVGVFLFWSGRRGSNSLPRPWQGRALPDELRPQTQGELYRIFSGLSTLHFHIAHIVKIVKISPAIPAVSPPFPRRPRGRSSPSSSCRPGPRGLPPRSAGPPAPWR